MYNVITPALIIRDFPPLKHKATITNSRSQIYQHSFFLKHITLTLKKINPEHF